MIFIISQLVVYGCSVRDYEIYNHGVAFEDSALKEKLIYRINNYYPQSFNTIHRCILDADNENYVFEGYVSINKPGQFRLLAKGDFGGTVFELEKHYYDSVKIVQNPAKIYNKFLSKGAAGDISAIYFNNMTSGAVLVQHQKNVVSIAQKISGDTQEEFYFDKENDLQLKSYVKSKGQKCLYRVDFSNFGNFKKWPQEVPRTIRINNVQLNYRLTITVLDLITNSKKYY